MIRVPIYLTTLESRMHPPVVKSKLLNKAHWDQVKIEDKWMRSNRSSGNED